MDEHDRLATLKFLEDWLQHGIAQIHAVSVREQHNAIEPENVERVHEHVQRRVNVGQWETGQTRKPVRPLPSEFGREVIAATRQRLRFGAAYERPAAGRLSPSTSPCQS